MSRATIAATVVEMADGRLALLVEMEPDPGLGPVVIDPAGDPAALADPDSPEETGEGLAAPGSGTLQPWPTRQSWLPRTGGPSSRTSPVAMRPTTPST